MSCSICLTHFLKIGYNESCNDAFHEPFISPLNFSGAQKLMILSCGPLPLIYICSVCPENNNFLERAFYKKRKQIPFCIFAFSWYLWWQKCGSTLMFRVLQRSDAFKVFWQIERYNIWPWNFWFELSKYVLLRPYRDISTSFLTVTTR